MFSLYDPILSRRDLTSRVLCILCQMRGSDPIRDLKRIRAWEEVLYTISVYLGSADVARQMLAHLTDIRDKFEASAFFRRHEVSTETRRDGRRAVPRRAAPHMRAR